MDTNENSPHLAAVQAVRRAAESGQIADIFKKLSDRSPWWRDPLLWVVMSVVGEHHIGSDGEIDWASVEVDRERVATPVTREIIANWLTIPRPAPALDWMAYFLGRWGDFEWIDTLVEYTRRYTPSQVGLVLREVVVRVGIRADAREWIKRHGELLAEHYNGSTMGTHFVLGSLTDTQLARYTEHCAENMERGFLDSLARSASRAPTAYTRLVLLDLEHRLSEDEDIPSNAELGVQRLGATQLKQLLTAACGNQTRFLKLAILICDRDDVGIEVLLEFLDHESRGPDAVRCLAMMGEQGRVALTHKLATIKHRQVHEMATALSRLPSVGMLRDPRRSSCVDIDYTQFYLPQEPLSTQSSPRYEPITIDALLTIVQTPNPAKTEVSPQHWADALQVFSWSSDLTWGFEQCRKHNLLGRGNERAALVAAVNRFDWNRVELDTQVPGIMYFLLGAEAPPDVLLHAMALVATVSPSINGVMVDYDEQIGAAFKQYKPPRWEQWCVLSRSFAVRGVNHFHDPVDRRFELERWATRERVDGPRSLEQPWESAAHHKQFRMRLQVSGASSICLKLHNAVSFEIDVEQEVWSQQGLEGPESGPTSLLDLHGDTVQVDVEVFQTEIRFGVGEVIVTTLTKELVERDLQAGPVVVSARGSSARLESLVITDINSYTDFADATNSILLGFSLQNVASAGTDWAAHALAVVACLGSQQEQRESASELLQEMGPVADPWRRALGLDSTAPKPFAIRSFEDCVSLFDSTKPDEQVRRGEVGEMQAVAFGLGEGNDDEEEEEYEDEDDDGYNYEPPTAISEPTLYLLNSEQSSDELLTDPDAIQELEFSAVTVWEAFGDGYWACEPDKWLIVRTMELVAEQDEDEEPMEFTLAAWRVEEGIACAVWTGDVDVLASIIGLRGWPPRDAWNPTRVGVGLRD